MNLKLEIEFNKANILHEVDSLKKQIDDMRPLPADVEGKVMQKLRLDWNYNSNAIEGNKLSYGETVALIMEGITANGKPLKDSLDIQGHNEAINFLLSIVKDSREFSEADIRGLHEMVLVKPYDVKAKTADGLPTTKRISIGEYKKLPNHVETATGELHYYASPEETPAKMQELMQWYADAANEKIHPLVIAALFHHKFVAIHPFDDGNGRLSRILMNLILMKYDYPPVIVKMDDRQNYYSLLSRSDRGDSWPFVEYIAERLQNSLQLYLKAAKGGDIDEDEDIEKEIALFKQSLITGNHQVLNSKQIDGFFRKTIIPFILRLLGKTTGFDDLFFQRQNKLNVNYLNIINKSEQLFETTNINQGSFLQFQEEYKITRVELKLLFYKFKYNDSNRFDIDKSLDILFNDEGFIINDAGRTILERFYYQEITKKDELYLIRHVVEDIKSSIDLLNLL